MIEKLYRINFQLPQDLAEEFAEYANILHITKARLLREWVVEGIQFTQVSPRRDEVSMTTFNFRLPEEEYIDLLAIVRQVNCTLSEYMRELINEKLNPIQSSRATMIEDVWINGKLKELLAQYEALNDPSPEHSIKLAKLHLELGNLIQSIEYLDEAENRLIAKDYSQAEFAEINILRASIAIKTRKLDAAKKHLHIAKQVLERQPDPLIDLEYNLRTQFSILADVQDDIALALKYSSSTLQLLNPAIDMSRLMRTYLKLADLNSVLLNWEAVTANLNKSQRMWRKLSLPTHLAFFLIRRPCIFNRQGEYSLAQSDLNQALSYLEEIPKVEHMYLFENKGICHMLQEEWGEAKTWLDKAITIEQTMSPDSHPTSKGYLMSLYLEAIDDLDVGLIRMRDQAFRNMRPHRKALLTYLIAAAKYNLGRRFNIRKAGERELIKLAKTAQVPIVLRAAQQTLEDRRLHIAC